MSDARKHLLKVQTNLNVFSEPTTLSKVKATLALLLVLTNKLLPHLTEKTAAPSRGQGGQNYNKWIKMSNPTSIWSYGKGLF